MLRSFFPWAAVRGWIRRQLVPVSLAVAIALGLGWASDASADAPATMYKYSYGGYTGKWGSTYAVACNYMNSANPSGWGTGYTWSLMSGQTTCGMFYNGSQFIVQVGVQTGSGCADGSNPDLTKPTGSQCGPPPPNCSDASVAGKYVGAWVVGSAGTAPGYACIQGCQYPQGQIAVAGSFGYGMAVSKGNGQTCSGANYDSIDTTTKPSDPPSPVSCAQLGQVYGSYTINGVTTGICSKAGDVPGSTVTKTDTKTSQTTDASGVQAPSQTTNTTTNITNVNGVPSVTQTTTKPDGTKETTTEPKDVFCASHPNDALCKTQSEASGGADCTAPPVCKGDAVQCAVLNQQWRSRCDLQKTDSSVTLGQQLANGQDPQASTLPSPGNASQVDVGSQLDNVSDMGLAAQCLPNINIPLSLPGSSGASLYIDTTPLCDFGRLFGYLNMLGTLMLCAYMLKGSF